MMVNRMEPGEFTGLQFNRTGSSITAIPFIQDGRNHFLMSTVTSEESIPQSSIAVFENQLSLFSARDASHSENYTTSLWR